MTTLASFVADLGRMKTFCGSSARGGSVILVEEALVEESSSFDSAAAGLEALVRGMVSDALAELFVF